MNAEGRPRTQHVAAMALIAAPTLAYVAALLFDPARTLVLWERATPPLRPLLLLTAGLAAHAALSLLILARMPAQCSRGQAALLLGYVVAAGLVLQTAAIHIVEPFPLRGLAFRQYSDFTGGYFSVGVRVDDLGAWLGRFAQEMESYNVHAERHPPGLPMIFWVGVQLMRPLHGLAEALGPTLRPLACFDLRAATLDDVQIAAGLFGILIETVLAWLTPILLFCFVRRIADDRAAATAALLCPLAPGMLMWASQWDRGFGVFTLAGLLLVEQLVARPRAIKSTASAVGLGLALSIGALMSFGNLPIVMICGLYALIRIWQTDRFRSLPAWALRGAIVLVGFAAPWAAMILLAGFDLPATYQTAMRIHLSLERDYWPFLVWHPWDIFTFVGLPAAAIALLMTWRHAPALTFAWVATITAQSLLHVARGETGRVWMYFAPVILALASMWITQRSAANAPGNARPVSWPHIFVTALMVIQATAHIALLRVIGYGVDPITVPNATPPADLIPYGDSLRAERRGAAARLHYAIQADAGPIGHAQFVLETRGRRRAAHVAQSLRARRRHAQG
ncbi:MAG: hypothetical protein KatS3mg052_2895 [Candidatus Roseilinea sp.]|nr:MAG: hypothetical protein KatS3mg052_2895 [Candidatus Roseilinea sp.]